MNKAEKTKTVYVLGAGFSKEAGAPSQFQIIGKMFEIYEKDRQVFSQSKFDEFIDLLENTFNIPVELQKTIPLEDIFTPLDRCVVDNITFRNLSVSDLRRKRDLLLELIGLTFEFLLSHAEKHYIDKFAEYLVESSSTRKNSKYAFTDLVSVISTNWDILLDNSIYNEIRNRNEFAVVDYCCYISSYDKGDKSVKPGLEILAQGGFNIKLLKLHGSLNWLQCPRCQRLYVKFNNKIAMNPYRDVNKPDCWHCNENFGEMKSHLLSPNLIMPTFLKDLSNPQYKIIWQNAGIELSEAKKVVFIGYSLPFADFEMRQLLARMVDSDTEIEVVDFKGADPRLFNELISRYEQFFGKTVTKHTAGAKNYVLNTLVG